MKSVDSGGCSAAKRKLASLEATKKAVASSGADDAAAAFISENDILGPRKKAKPDYEERMASIARGREDREKFGSQKGKAERKRRRADRRTAKRHGTGRS